jgi:hypothetical protein
VSKKDNLQLQAHILFRTEGLLYVKVTGTVNGVELDDHVMVPDQAGKHRLSRLVPEFDRHHLFLALRVGT